jgi:hypothetical protein
VPLSWTARAIGRSQRLGGQRAPSWPGDPGAGLSFPPSPAVAFDARQPREKAESFLNLCFANRALARRKTSTLPWTTKNAESPSGQLASPPNPPVRPALPFTLAFPASATCPPLPLALALPASAVPCAAVNSALLVPTCPGTAILASARPLIIVVWATLAPGEPRTPGARVARRPGTGRSCPLVKRGPDELRDPRRRC